MTETVNLTSQEVKEILAIFFDLPVEKIKNWNNGWQFDASAERIKAKIKQHHDERDAEHKAE